MNANQSSTAPRLLVVSGTDRPGSRTLMLAHQLHGVLEGIGACSSLLDLSGLPQGFFSPAAYDSRKDPDRPEVRAWMSAQGLLFVVPEYNGSFPGALKHYIDLLPFPAALSGKSAAFVGLAAGQWGGGNAVAHLSAILANRGSYLFPERVLIPGADEEIGEGFVTPAYAERLARLCAGFLIFSEKTAAN